MGVVTVSGSAVPNAKVVIAFPDGEKKTITVPKSGKYTVVSQHYAPSGPIKVTEVYNHAMLTKTLTFNQPINSPTGDNTKNKKIMPSTITITGVAREANGGIRVTGKATGGAKVTVRFPNGSTSTTIASNVTYTVHFPGSQPIGEVIASDTLSDPNGKIIKDTKDAHKHYKALTITAGTPTILPDSGNGWYGGDAKF